MLQKHVIRMIKLKNFRHKIKEEKKWKNVIFSTPISDIDNVYKCITTNFPASIIFFSKIILFYRPKKKMCECIDTSGILLRHIIEKIFYNIMITLKHIFRNVTHSSLGRMSPCV